VSAIFSQATVYSGAQTIQYLYMLGAVGQVLILSTSSHAISSRGSAARTEIAEQPFQFVRVL